LFESYDSIKDIQRGTKSTW